MMTKNAFSFAIIMVVIGHRSEQKYSVPYERYWQAKLILCIEIPECSVKGTAMHDDPVESRISNTFSLVCFIRYRLVGG